MQIKVSLIMKKPMVFALMALCIAGLVAPVSATVVENMSLERMIDYSKIIVTGKVVSKEIRWDNDRGEVYTYYKLAIDNPVKGSNQPSDIVTLRIIGGEWGNLLSYVAGTPKFRTGEEVLLFLDELTPGNFAPVGWQMGYYMIERDDETGTILARRSSISNGVGVMGMHDGTDPPQSIALDKFVHIIKDITARQNGAGTRGEVE
ncbi:hypothetical protein ACFLU6_05225 [Acidobacteriota bacterium]